MVHLDLSDTISLNRISAWKWDQANYCWKEQLKKIDSVAAIAPSFCLHLSFLRPVFESQAPHLCFSNLHYWNCHEKGTKKQAGIGPFKKENSFTIRWHKRTFVVGGSITVRLVSRSTSLDSTGSLQKGTKSNIVSYLVDSSLVKLETSCTVLGTMEVL